VPLVLTTFQRLWSLGAESTLPSSDAASRFIVTGRCIA
jgi:hypothetical protein